MGGRGKATTNLLSWASCPGWMRAIGWAVVLLLGLLPVPSGQAGLAFSPSDVASDPVDDWGSPPSNGTGNSTGPTGPPGGAPVEESDFCIISSEVGKYCTTLFVPDPEAAPPLPDPAAQPEPTKGAEDAAMEEEAAGEASQVGGTAAAEAEATAVVATEGAPVPYEQEGQAGSSPSSPPVPEVVGPMPETRVQPEPGGSVEGRSTHAGISDPTWVALALAVPWVLGLKAVSLLALGRGSRSNLREAVLALVAADPGLRHAELVRRLGRGNGTVEHHVRTLLAEGRLARLRRGGSTGYYPASMPEGHARLRLALQGATARRLAETLAREPGLRLTEAARRAGVSSPTAHYHLRRLVAAGVLRGDAGRFEVAPAALPLLAAAAPPEEPEPQTFVLEPRPRIADLAQDTPV